VTAEWAACGASVTGSMHQRRGLGCDDAYSYGVARDFVIAAVADGAGSVSGTSAWGAYVACQSVLGDAMQPAFIDGFRSASIDHADKLVRWLFDGALARVHRQADAMGLDVTLLSTTLCVAVAHRELAVFGQVGDGVIAVDRAGRIETLLVERKVEYANTTSFIQSDRALDVSFHTATRTGVTAFGLSTDGMSYKITDVATGEAYEPFFRGCWQHLRAGAKASSFAGLLGGIEDDQTGDDKTMVLAVIRDDGDVADGRTVTDSSAPPHDGAAAADHPADTVRTDPLPGADGGSDAATEPISAKSSRRGHRWWRRQRR
jgi:hypothetical protein